MEKELFPRYGWRPRYKGGSKPWPIDKSSFTDYKKDFIYLNADGFLNTIFERLRSLPYPPVVVDLMSRPEAVSDFQKKELKNQPIEGFAVGLVKDYIPSAPIFERRANIHYIRGDITKSRTWRELNAKTNKKVNLYMERAFGGLHHLPTDIRFERIVMQKIWESLDCQFGATVLQTPPFNILEQRGILIYRWLDKLKKQEIDFRYVPSYLTREKQGKYYGLLALTKDKNIELPAIDL